VRSTQFPHIVRAPFLPSHSQHASPALNLPPNASLGLIPVPSHCPHGFQPVPRHTGHRVSGAGSARRDASPRASSAVAKSVEAVFARAGRDARADDDDADGANDGDGRVDGARVDGTPTRMVRRAGVRRELGKTSSRRRLTTGQS
jgi:hypothetical protein